MDLPPGYSITATEQPHDLKEFCRLALEYQQWLNVDLCFQVCYQRCHNAAAAGTPATGWALAAAGLKARAQVHD